LDYSQLQQHQYSSEHRRNKQHKTTLWHFPRKKSERKEGEGRGREVNNPNEQLVGHPPETQSGTQNTEHRTKTKTRKARRKRKRNQF